MISVNTPTLTEGHLYVSFRFIVVKPSSDKMRQLCFLPLLRAAMNFNDGLNWCNLGVTSASAWSLVIMFIGKMLSNLKFILLTLFSIL